MGEIDQFDFVAGLSFDFACYCLHGRNPIHVRAYHGHHLWKWLWIEKSDHAFVAVVILSDESIHLVDTKLRLFCVERFVCHNLTNHQGTNSFSGALLHSVSNVRNR